MPQYRIGDCDYMSSVCCLQSVVKHCARWHLAAVCGGLDNGATPWRPPLVHAPVCLDVPQSGAMHLQQMYPRPQVSMYSLWPRATELRQNREARKGAQATPCSRKGISHGAGMKK